MFDNYLFLLILSNCWGYVFHGLKKLDDYLFLKLHNDPDCEQTHQTVSFHKQENPACEKAAKTRKHGIHRIKPVADG